MTIRYTNFTPEALLSAPRRSTATANPSGSKLVYSVSTYSFHSHQRTSEIRIIDIVTRKDTAICSTSSFREPVWLSDNEVLLLGSTGNSNTTINITDIRYPGAINEITRISGSLENIRIKRLSDTEIAFVVAAPTTPDGKLYNAADEKPKHSTAKIYTSLFVRHWDTYTTENKNSVWYGLLKKVDGKYVLAEPGLINALAGSGLECPVPSGPGSYHFDLSVGGIAFVAKDPTLDPALFTKTDLYFVPLSSYTEVPIEGAPRIVETPELQGYTASPTFSNSGKQLIFTRMRHIQYESDKRRLMLIPDVSDLSIIQELYATEDGEGSLDQSPDDLTWSHDDSEILFSAEYKGAVNLYKVPASADYKDKPVPIFEGKSVLHAEPLDTTGKLLISSSSLVDSMAYDIVDTSTSTATTDQIFSSTQNGSLFGLSSDQVDDLWFTGAANQQVHAIVVRPNNFDPAKNYPLAFLIHGGPQGAWNNGWSTRWNPAIFAQQGFIAVACNPTGSTGYGQAFTDAIANDWGGRPYQDLVACIESIESTMPYVDMGNAVALGASYGGYMINWIAGQPLADKFTALVCHDGIFSTHTKWATEELFFPYHDFGGAPWDEKATYKLWDPAQNHDRWHTPMLVIHNELDYRLPISEGLAMFNVLQAKKIRSKFLMFPDENHWVLKPENSLVWHREVLRFINEYTGNKGLE